MTRIKNITPRKKYLHKVIVDFKKSLCVINRRHLVTKKKLVEARNFIKKHGLLISKMNETSINFFKTQLKSQYISPRGRRFSIDDKIFALSLFKSSAKTYRLLSKTFALPSRKTLMDLLRQLQLEPGVNDQIINHLKETVGNFKNKLDTHCVLLFDEVSLAAGTQYCELEDKIIGFQDLGNDNRKLKFADKALVFMVRGIKRKFKQSISFYFTESGMKTPDLVVALKETIRAVQATGLKIIATVCDQAPTNVAALNILHKETIENYTRKGIEKKTLGFEIDGIEIVPLYDPPHLLKDKLRLDIGERMAPKLTDSHIYPDRLKKMKVSVAAQVFSQRVGSIMLMLSEWAGEQEDKLNIAAADTAKLCLFIDKLFDSVNSSSTSVLPGKELRGAVFSTSAHWKFWNEAIQILESMKFSSWFQIYNIEIL
ncbi:uncharacterized protein LOC111029326 [Myzus persicae]|uniref:uncharacterized protein LOC111029326 n=1 Tax=Myzus persicae TaxID=13164 RepID=UPI000B93265F|nr:uncharacterized protein LOC111029326 [Myzus persicae]